MAVRLVALIFLVLQFVVVPAFDPKNPCGLNDLPEKGKQLQFLVVARYGKRNTWLACEEFIKNQTEVEIFEIDGYEGWTNNEIEALLKDKRHLLDFKFSHSDLRHFSAELFKNTLVARVYLDDNENLTTITGAFPGSLRVLSAKNCPKLNNVSGVFGHKSISIVDFSHTAVKEDCATLHTYLPTLENCTDVYLKDIRDNTDSNSTQKSETTTNMPPEEVDKNKNTGGMGIVIAVSVILTVIVLGGIIILVLKETPIQWFLNKRKEKYRGRQQVSTSAEEPNNPFTEINL